MYKKIMLLTLLMAVFALGIVSAECPQNATTVGGTVYLQGTNTTIPGAGVTIMCITSSGNVTHDTTSDGLGHYDTLFTVNDTVLCNQGDLVMVNAISGSMTGMNSDIVNDSSIFIPGSGDECSVNLNVEVIDVPLVPEFGLIAGGATLTLAIAALYFIRRRK